MKKGLSAWIYRDSFYRSELAVLGKVDQVVILDKEAPGPFEPDDKSPAVKLVRRQFGERVYVHAEPIIEGREGGFAFGGSFIFTSDSRFPQDYPIPLHDYDMNLEAKLHGNIHYD